MKRIVLVVIASAVTWTYCLVANGDEGPAHVAAPVVLPVDGPVVVNPPPPAVMVPVPDPAAKSKALAQALADLDKKIHDAAAAIGVDVSKVPPAWLDTTTGKVVVGITIGILTALTITEGIVGVVQATK